MTLIVSNKGMKSIAATMISLFSGSKKEESIKDLSSDKNFNVKKPMQKPIINEPVSPINIFLLEEKLNLRYANNIPIILKHNKK